MSYEDVIAFRINNHVETKGFINELINTKLYISLVKQLKSIFINFRKVKNNPKVRRNCLRKYAVYENKVSRWMIDKMDLFKKYSNISFESFCILFDTNNELNV